MTDTVTQPKPKFGSKESRVRVLPDGREVDMASKEWKVFKKERDLEFGLDERATVPKRAKAPKVDTSEKKLATRAAQAAEWGMIAGSFFGGAALMTGHDHWALSDPEAKDLGGAIAGVVPSLPKRAVKILNDSSPWVRLLLVGARVVGPRVVMERAINEGTVSAAPAAPAAAPAYVPPPPGRPDVIFPTMGTPPSAGAHYAADV